MARGWERVLAQDLCRTVPRRSTAHGNLGFMSRQGCMGPLLEAPGRHLHLGFALTMGLSIPCLEASQWHWRLGFASIQGCAGLHLEAPQSYGQHFSVRLTKHSVKGPWPPGLTCWDPMVKKAGRSGAAGAREGGGQSDLARFSLREEGRAT